MPKTETLPKVPVSRRAFVQRLERRLARDGKSILTSREGTWARKELGEFYIVNARAQRVVEDHVDPEALGRELGVLKPFERLVGGDGR